MFGLDLAVLATDMKGHTFQPRGDLISPALPVAWLPSDFANVCPSGMSPLGNSLAQSRTRNAKVTNGTVKFYNSTKGFGFITPDSGGKDAFVHVSALERSGISGLTDGLKVTYDLERGRDGRESAINLQLA